MLVDVAIVTKASQHMLPLLKNTRVLHLSAHFKYTHSILSNLQSTRSLS